MVLVSINILISVYLYLFYIVLILLLFVIACLILHEQDWKEIDQTRVKILIGISSQWQAYVENGQNCQWPEDGHYELRYVACDNEISRYVNEIFKS